MEVALLIIGMIMLIVAFVLYLVFKDGLRRGFNTIKNGSITNRVFLLVLESVLLLGGITLIIISIFM